MIYNIFNVFFNYIYFISNILCMNIELKLNCLILRIKSISFKMKMLPSKKKLYPKFEFEILS